jgi:hypothetical protein
MIVVEEGSTRLVRDEPYIREELVEDLVLRYQM